tara:strand:- start:3905 stop:4042 length:138 start_codon:yes stop_codon:yes gene_type:complete
MSASGNYKRIPDESAFIPTAVAKPQSPEEMMAEIQKLNEMRQSDG